jgi:hypothetical protein
VLALREAESACQKPGPNQGGKQGGGSREKMQGLANEQGDLNQESQSLAERLTRQHASRPATSSRSSGSPRSSR